MRWLFIPFFIAAVIAACGTNAFPSHGPTNAPNPCGNGGQQAHAKCQPSGAVSSPSPQPTTGVVAPTAPSDVWCDIDSNNGGSGVATAMGRSLCNYAENQKPTSGSAATNAYVWCANQSACFVTQYFKDRVFQEGTPDCGSGTQGNPYDAFWALGPGGNMTITEVRIAYHASGSVAGVSTRMNKDSASTGCISSPVFALQVGQSVVETQLAGVVNGTGGLSTDPIFGLAAVIDEDNASTTCAGMLGVGCPSGNTAITDGSNGVGIKDSNYSSATPGPGQNTMDSESKKWHDFPTIAPSISGGSCGTVFGGASPCPDPYSGQGVKFMANQFGTEGIGKANVSRNTLDQITGGNGSTNVVGGQCEGCAENTTSNFGERYTPSRLAFDVNTASVVVAAGFIYKDHVAYCYANPCDVANSGDTGAAGTTMLQERIDYIARVGLFYSFRGCSLRGVSVSCTPFDFQVNDENDCVAQTSCTPPTSPGGTCKSSSVPVCGAVQRYPEDGIVFTQPEETMGSFQANFNSSVGPNNGGTGCGNADNNSDGGMEDELVGETFVNNIPPSYPVTYPDSCGFSKASGAGVKTGVEGRIYDACYHSVSGTMTLIGKCAVLVSGRLSDSSGSGNGDYHVPCHTNIGLVSADFTAFGHSLTLANTSFMAIGSDAVGTADTSGYHVGQYSDANVAGASFVCSDAGTGTVVPGGHGMVLFP